VITTYLSPLQLFKGGAVTSEGVGEAHLSPLL
jgi:hypothetical protein